MKVKRIRKDPRVALTPCGRRGKVGTNATAVTGLAGIIRRKYGVEYRIVTFVERLMAGGEKPRVILRIELSH